MTNRENKVKVEELDRVTGGMLAINPGRLTIGELKRGEAGKAPKTETAKLDIEGLEYVTGGTVILRMAAENARRKCEKEKEKNWKIDLGEPKEF